MVTLTDIRNARENIKGYVHKTPILTSSLLDEVSGNTIFLKSEHLQKTGSFKIRGATNKVQEAVKNGAKFITAASSGNHGQAVAYIANQLGVPSTIVVPEDANIVKVAAIEAYNGKVVKCGTMSAERIPRAIQLADENDGVFIPPYDDPYIIAGQGTLGLEILEQVPNVDIIVVPVGGGGLLSGILAAVKQLNPNVKVIGVEPATANDTHLSLQAGAITSIPPTKTIADGLRTSQPGDLTFPIVKRYLDDLVLVTEEEIKEALEFLLERTKQIVEPSSAVTIAAILSGKLNVKGKRIVAVLSGGNVDLRQLINFLPESN
ncbi:threonine/serine dehydratase [Sporosarcina sp. G11-34]|uniref:threonine/serine dehydratase n=1 Tax=Sporosarcina sp. G11-34 TaxID=2849605 RepID=UPI0022A9E926|nr:threonine/serine dehydratase [Sporosarcina sp. G11-34]MCZ2259666.1 threonine/serine dehydratase [Sporosarcina sp. G11-34]